MADDTDQVEGSAPGWGPGRCCRWLLLPLLGLLLALPADAAELRLHGRVTETAPDTGYEVWLTDTPDLADDRSPLAQAVPDAAGQFELAWSTPEPRPPLWLFLRQELPLQDGQPMVFFLPWDLLPLGSAQLQEDLEIRALPVELARMQLGGERPTGWWHTPLLLTLLLLLAVPAAALVLRRRSRQFQEGPGVPGPPRTAHLPPEAAWERPSMLGLLLLATGLRISRMGESLELLEHTYGPGLPGVRESAGPSLGQLLRSFGSESGPVWADLLPGLLEPPSLIVTHPPLYHWLTAGLSELQVGDWLLRLPALLASLATVVLLWRLLRRVAPGAGVMAAAAFTLSAPGIFYGGDASPYALVAAICVGSVLLLLRALEDGRKRAWAAWLGLLALGFLCHYTVAIFGLLQAAVLAAFFLKHRSDPSWLTAAGRILSLLPVVGLLPVLWTWPHFATFEVVGLDTRLMAEAFPRNPGLLPWARDVVAVLCAVAPRHWPAALPLLLLAGRGLVLARRRDPLLGALFATSLVAGLVGVFFFYFNAIEILHGRVFWGFRWVSWLSPMALGIAAAGLVGLQGPVRGAALLAAGLWLVAAGFFCVSPDSRSTRPDYAGAAQVIAAEVQDGDGVATLPLWGQRGPLLWYVSQELNFDLRSPAQGWPVRLFSNPTHEQLPFETSGNNGHIDRLWLAIADERMFGRPKFVGAQAEQALQWARTHMQPDGHWSRDHLELYRFRRGEEIAWDGTEPLDLTHPKADIRSIRYQEPNQWNCGQRSDYDLTRSDTDSPDADGWILYLRVPLAEDMPRISATVQDGRITPIEEPGFWSAVVVGGRCSDPPPRVRLERLGTDSL